MKDLIKKILNEQVSDKVITKVLSQLESGKIKPPYFKNLDLIGLTDDEIQTTLEQFTNGEVNIKHRTLTDESGNIIYDEDDNGFWYKSEYDGRGNLIYVENSNGFWVKKEYDERGKLIYRESSDGDIIDKR